MTVDIWTDRSMHGFLSVTAHFMEMENSALRLQAVLLSCEKFTAPHTGIKISDQFEEICDKFNIKHKLYYIICDNSLNMNKIRRPSQFISLQHLELSGTSQMMRLNNMMI